MAVAHKKQRKMVLRMPPGHSSCPLSRTGPTTSSRVSSQFQVLSPLCFCISQHALRLTFTGTSLHRMAAGWDASRLTSGLVLLYVGAGLATVNCQDADLPTDSLDGQIYLPRAEVRECLFLVATYDRTLTFGFQRKTTSKHPAVHIRGCQDRCPIS